MVQCGPKLFRTGTLKMKKVTKEDNDQPDALVESKPRTAFREIAQELGTILGLLKHLAITSILTAMSFLPT